MKKALLLLVPILFISCAKDVQEEIVEQTPIVQEKPQEIQEAPEEIVYPTMREYIDLFENNIRGHFDFDAPRDTPLQDFISIVDEENYYVKLDYSTDEIPLESKELDAAITVFLKNDGSHLIAFQGRLCPRSFFPCSQVTDFYTYEKDENGWGLKSILYHDQPVSYDDLYEFEEEGPDPRAYLGYYLELPRFDATLRLVESGYAFNKNCEIDFFDEPRSQIHDCDYYPGDDGEMVQDLLQTFDFEYTPGFTLQELKWNGEEFVIQ